MRIGNSEGIVIFRKTSVSIGGGLGFSFTIPTGYSWINLTSTDGSSLVNVLGGGATGSYVLIVAASYIQILRTTGTTGSIWFESGTLGQNIAGSIPANTSGYITLQPNMCALLQKQADNSWLVVNVSAGRNGMPGNQGFQGFQGTQGFQGEPGNPGGTGPDGFPGPQGVQGIQGPTGADGPEGNRGTQGPPGTVGNQGNQGQTGNPGTPC